MYEAVRQRARGSTQMAGAATTAMAMAAAGYVFMAGFAPQIAKAIEERTILTTVIENTTDRPPPETTKLDTTTDVLPVPAPVWTPPEEVDKPPPVASKPGPDADAKPGPSITVPAAPAKRIAPKLRGDV